MTTAFVAGHYLDCTHENLEEAKRYHIQKFQDVIIK